MNILYELSGAYIINCDCLRYPDNFPAHIDVDLNVGLPRNSFLFVFLKGNTKFWEILKIGWIVNLYNFDILGCPCGCIISTNKINP